MAYPSNDVPGRRAARLSLVSVVLWLLAIVLLILAAVIGYSGQATGTTAYLPLPVTYSRPALSIIFAALAACGAVLVGLAAAQTTAAMRVLDRDRRIPPTISAEARQKASRILGPAAVAHYQLDHDTTPPPSAIRVPLRPAPSS
jgi:TRAP-type C4-dicarboxylate transport system permease small subunit